MQTGSTNFLNLEYFNRGNTHPEQHIRHTELDRIDNKNIDLTEAWTLSASISIATLETSGGGGGGGGSGRAGQTVWVAASAISGTEYANGLGYVPLPSGSTNSIEFQFVSPSSASIEVNVLYAMGAANAGGFEAQLDYVTIGTGSVPTTALSTQAAFVVTPGNDANLHAINSGSNATMVVSADDGDIVLMKFSRNATANDTHISTLNVIEIRVK